MYKITRFGRTLEPHEYSMSEDMKIFRSGLDFLVLDFTDMEGWTITVGDDCTISTNYSCDIKAGHRCNINTGGSCSFHLGMGCVLGVTNSFNIIYSEGWLSLQVRSKVQGDYIEEPVVLYWVDDKIKYTDNLLAKDIYKMSKEIIK